MKKKADSETKGAEVKEMRPEYDFKSMAGGIRGKYYRAYSTGHCVEVHEADSATTVQHFAPDEGAVTLEPDVREYFPDSEAVNKALRALIALIPAKTGAPAKKG
jgi:hypothetical protein